MANGKMQGNGKVRLIAKKGRYQDDANSQRLRRLVQAGADPSILTDPVKARDYLGSGVNAADIVSNYYIEFDVTPDITEAGSVSYFEAGDIRGPGSILMYMGSPARNFTISAKLVARNAAEAIRVNKQIHILKSWRQPESYVGGLADGTPTLLYLQGYGKMFKDIPTVMTDLSIEFSSEHDAIAVTGQEYAGSVNSETYTEYLDGRSRQRTKSTPVVTHYDSAVPIIVPVSISLKEARSVEGDLEGFDTFDIIRYRNGTLVGW